MQKAKNVAYYEIKSVQAIEMLTGRVDKGIPCFFQKNALEDWELLIIIDRLLCLEVSERS